MSRGPAPAELTKAFLADQRRRAATALMGIPRRTFDELFDEMLELPTLDVSMQVRLPRLLTPEVTALRSAVGEEDDEGVEVLVAPVVAQLDDPQRRAELVTAVIALAASGRIASRLAAVAIIDLTTDPSALLRASLLQAVAVSVGAARTPAGLLVASR